MDDLFDPRRPPKPERLPASMWFALGAAYRHINRGKPLTKEVLDPEMRSRLLAWHLDLRDLMRPGTRAEILSAYRTLVELRGGHKPSTLEEAKELAEQRVNDLGIVPIWALWDAATATRRELIGRVSRLGSKPRDGELLILARRYAEPFFEELRLLERVLREKVVEEPTPDDFAKRKEMAERMKAFGATLGRDKKSGSK